MESAIFLTKSDLFDRGHKYYVRVQKSIDSRASKNSDSSVFYTEIEAKILNTKKY